MREDQENENSTRKNFSCGSLTLSFSLRATSVERNTHSILLFYSDEILSCLVVSLHPVFASLRLSNKNSVNTVWIEIFIPL